MVPTRRVRLAEGAHKSGIPGEICHQTYCYQELREDKTYCPSVIKQKEKTYSRKEKIEREEKQELKEAMAIACVHVICSTNSAVHICQKALN